MSMQTVSLNIYDRIARLCLDGLVTAMMWYSNSFPCICFMRVISLSAANLAPNLQLDSWEKCMNC